MEPNRVVKMFERSISKHNLRHCGYYGDGDTKGYGTVKDIYGGLTVRKKNVLDISKSVLATVSES